MSNMWEISQRFWMKYVDNNDYGYEEYEAIHWINHDFLVILNFLIGAERSIFGIKPLQYA